MPNTMNGLSRKEAPSRTQNAKSTNTPVVNSLSGAGQWSQVQAGTLPLTSTDVLQLQRTVGNRTVAQLLARNQTAPAQPLAAQPPTIQPKMKVGPAKDRYEEEADQVAEEVTQDSTVPTVTRSAAPMIQRAVTMYDSFDDARAASKKEKITGKETELDSDDLGSTFVQVETALGTANENYTKKERKAMKEKLKEWISKDARMSPTKAWFKHSFSGGESLTSGRAQDKRYGSYEDLGRALLGHIRSRQHKKTESKLAQKAKKSSYIKGKLREVQQAIYTAAEAMTNTTTKTDFWAGMGGAKGKSGEYFHWYKSVSDVKKMMRKGTGDFAEAIASIHDASTVMNKFRGFGKSGLDTAMNEGVIDSWGSGANYQGTFTKDDGGTERRNISNTYRANSTTVNEGDDWVKEARANNALLWAGPSHTTSNMMMLMKGLENKVPGVDTSHTEAVAWAIFAFWNKDFFTFKDGYHTFHEVMDIAKGFNVRYTPFQYPKNPPPYPPDPVDMTNPTDVVEEESSGESV